LLPHIEFHQIALSYKPDASIRIDGFAHNPDAISFALLKLEANPYFL
jgi:hypothetical protein